MTPPNKTFAANPAVLGAFVRAVATAGDSPTVVRRVAENAAYVYLCRAIVQLDRPGVPPLLGDACRAADITPPRLMARLAPVAQALRLVPEDSDDTYYKLLGVPPESDATIIRQAYRRRARDLHPDLQPDQAADPQAFTKLTTAYQTLRDPVAKEAYDARPDPDGTWFEPEPQLKPARPRRARFTAVIVVVVLLVAATLVLDHLYREHARQSAYHASQIGITRPVIPPPPPTEPLPAQPPRSVASIPATTAEPPATRATVTTPAIVSPEITPVVLPLESSTTETNPPSPAPAPIVTQPIVATSAPIPSEPPPTEDTRVADHRRVAVFYTSENDGQLSEKLTVFLANQGYLTPRIAQASSDRPSDIRYFNVADHDDARALRVMVRRFLAQATGRPGLPVRLKNLSRRYPRTDKGLLEVWVNTRPLEPIPTSVATVSTAATTAAKSPPAPTTTPPIEDRIRAFLDDYCRTYESRDLDRLADLFDTSATENGQPFVDLLPRYRANMARIERLAYRIEIERWEPRKDSKTLAVQGRFFADGQLTDQKQYHSQGTIALDIVPRGESYRVARLTYQVE